MPHRAKRALLATALAGVAFIAYLADQVAWAWVFNALAGITLLAAIYGDNG